MSIYLIGDLHGQYQGYERLLVSSGLCDESLRWTGGTSQLWLMGDFFDRGASGIRCLDLTIRLQKEAVATGGLVNSLLGNHELMMLYAHRFADTTDDEGLSAYDHWLDYGGTEADFEAFTDEHAQWIGQLPAMALLDDNLMIHADAMLYVNHGMTIEAVNDSFAELMTSDDISRWVPVLASFGEHEAFSSLDIAGPKRAEQLLSLYGGRCLIHGHTPISWARQIEPETVTEAWLYADGLCLNVDGGMYMGGSGFMHQLR